MSENISSFVKAKLTRTEGEFGKILVEGQEIKWPKSALPVNLKEDEDFYLIAKKNPANQDDQAELTKAILEEILNGEEKK